MARSTHRVVVLLLFVLFFGATSAAAQSFVPTGFLRGGSTRRDPYAVAQLGFDWQATSWLNLHAQGVASHFEEDDRVGVTEAFADAGAGAWRLRAGMFFLPTSRENREDL
ncbi:MAG: hypothetical protein JOZ54_05570, partial [Acidobacteria bacterium]|nr:hypothetical protein [Acidobacteriota bacterium]